MRTTRPGLDAVNNLNTFVRRRAALFVFRHLPSLPQSAIVANVAIGFRGANRARYPAAPRPVREMRRAVDAGSVQDFRLDEQGSIAHQRWADCATRPRECRGAFNRSDRLVDADYLASLRHRRFETK